MMELLYKIWAGIIYLPFNLVGIKDEQLIQIIVCLIIYPIAFNLLYFSNIFTFKGKLMKIISGIWFLISCYITKLILNEHLFGSTYFSLRDDKFVYREFNGIIEDKERIFNLLKGGHNALAEIFNMIFHTNISYHTMYVIFYIIIPILLVLFNFYLLKLNKTNNRHSQFNAVQKNNR